MKDITNDHAKLVALVTRLGGYVTVDENGVSVIVSLRGSETLDHDVQSISGQQITELDLAETEVTGAAFEGIERLPNLRTIDVSYTQIRDQDLSALRDAKQLTNLSLYGCDISEAGLQFVSAIKTLLALDLSETRVANLESLKALTRLQGLHLDGCDLVDNASLHGISDLAQLSHLSLASTSISGEGLATLQCLPNLLELKVFATKLTDDDISVIGTCKKLQTLYLSQLPITDRALDKLLDLQELETLYVDGTNITDRGLTTLVKIPSLRKLVLPKSISKQARTAMSRACPELTIVD